MSIYIYLLVVFLWVALPLHETKSDPPANSIPMKVQNHAGRPVGLFWIDINNPANLINQTTKPVRNNSAATINSYEGHEFLVKLRDEIPGSEVKFAKGPSEETVTITFDEVTQRLVVTKKSKEDEMMEMVEKHVQTCQNLHGSDIADCLSREISSEVEKMEAAKELVESYRDIMSNKLRNYTCADPLLEPSTPDRTTILSIGGKSHNVSVYMDLDTAKIWTVEDFVSIEDCRYLIDTSRPQLSRATVSDDNGQDSYSEHRRAQQYSFDLEKDSRARARLWHLYNRIIQVVNDRAEYSLRPEGQEGITVIQYNVGDEYTPHCDGACDGSFFKPGGRVASAVLYCHTPEQGGALTFSRADLFLKPQPGTAVFFSYKGADGRVDEGYTDHSGCPVQEGEKWIATAWLREGVTSEQTWEKFDPEGIEILEIEEDNEEIVADEGQQGEIMTNAAEEAEFGHDEF